MGEMFALPQALTVSHIIVRALSAATPKPTSEGTLNRGPTQRGGFSPK